MSTGWQCPGCSGCYSPSTSACPRCCAEVVTSDGTGVAPIVSAPPAWPPPCPHLRRDIETTMGARCLDCGANVNPSGLVVWDVRLTSGIGIESAFGTFVTGGAS